MEFLCRFFRAKGYMGANSIQIGWKHFRVRWSASGPASRILTALKNSIWDAPLEPILHASPWRLRLIGATTVIGHLAFAWLWGIVLPQSYENIWVRIFAAGSGLLLMVNSVAKNPISPATQIIFSLVCWAQLPLLFFWFYFMNHGSTVWLAACASMIIIYYYLTDWRLATIGIALGGSIAWWLGPGSTQLDAVQVQTRWAVIGFCWASGFVLGLSSSNMRREHLKHTLATMGITAHELRTPLATISLIGDALKSLAAVSDNPVQQEKMDKLAARLLTSVRAMNQQIDAQIVNARMLDLPRRKENLSAQSLVEAVVAQFPYRSTRERECVTVDVRHDFLFQGSQDLFMQVISNLIKNALNALAHSSSPPQKGDLVIRIGVQHSVGRIEIADRGKGMEPAVLRRIFEPFYSTNTGTGHGLGLSFCKRAVSAVDGRIRVKSKLGVGTAFTIELPSIP